MLNRLVVKQNNAWRLVLCAGLLLVGAVTSAQNRTDRSPSRAETADARVQRFTLRDLGAQEPLQFRGVDHSIYLPLIVRLDQTVVSAKLKAQYTLSPSLVPELSQVKVLVNDEAMGVLPAVKGRLGAPQTADVDLDPRFFTEFAKLRLQFIGHYTYDCEFPFHTSLWANVSNESVLELVTKPLALRNDLALLPAPFFDLRDSRRLVLPFVLPAKPSLATVHDALVMASWFGSLADYRGAQFPVYQDRLPTRHAVVLATNEERPSVPGLSIAPVEMPTISVLAHPADPAVKLLLVQGKDAAQLKLAVDGLALGQALLTGDRSELTAVKYPERRAAYDAPAIVKTGRVVKLGELVSDRNALQVRGVSLDTIRTNLRLPADVAGIYTKGVPLDLRYRFTPPVALGQGSLTIRANDQLVQSLLLPPARTDSATDKVATMLQGDLAEATLSTRIPAFQLGARNVLGFQFDLPQTDEGRCRTTPQSGFSASVDPDSTIDLRGVEHYTKLPNLALFASGGFPFTKYGDLGQTAIVLPDNASAAELEAAFGAAGHLGAVTGMAGIAMTVLPTSRVKEAGDKDVLLIQVGADAATLAAWGQTLPAKIDGSRRASSPLGRLASAVTEWFTGAVPPEVPRNGWAEYREQGPLGALISFESPLSSKRAVVAINATDSSTLNAAVEAFTDPRLAGKVHGDLTLVRGAAIEGYRVGDVFSVGRLSWWRWIWFQFEHRPLLLALLGLALGILVALLINASLRRVEARRLADPR